LLKISEKNQSDQHTVRGAIAIQLDPPLAGRTQIFMAPITDTTRDIPCNFRITTIFTSTVIS